MDILEIAKTAPIVNADWTTQATVHRQLGFDGSLFRMWAGQSGTAHVYVWANSFESAFEELSEWCDDNAPGHITDVTMDDLKETAEELGLKWKSSWPDFEDRQFVKVAEKAEEDLTIVGHTTLKHGQYMVSYEWGGEEVEPSGKEYELVWERSKEEAGDDDDEEEDEEGLEPNPNKAYTHFVVMLRRGGTGDRNDWRIQSGWEYQEDAKDAKAELPPSDRKEARVVTRRWLKQQGVDPQDSANWLRG